MSFITIEYGLFLLIVFVLYWSMCGHSIKKQNVLLLIASYIFYGWWDWRFLSLIFISSQVDFVVGLLLENTEQKLKRRLLLYVSLSINLGILFLFKYFNFFLDTFKSLFSISETSFTTIDIVLPVGISFYTLQTLSYTIDIYDKKLKPCRDFTSFFAYVSFFPQLVAGPIERATHLLPQFQTKRTFSYRRGSDGMRQILWGLFKKLLVADHCGIFVNEVFADPSAQHGSTLFLALLVFSFQLYGDFSGYSDIAIGSAHLLGFNLSKNFDYPFFSRNVSEFWKKWHISLFEWFRVYIVNKLKGFSTLKVARNTLIVFFISGLWHGADYNFIVWGLLHALAFLPLIYWKRKKHKHLVAEGKLLPSLKESAQMTYTFLIFSVLNVFFRIDTVKNGILYLKGIFSLTFFRRPDLPQSTVVISIFVLLMVEWLQRDKNHGLEIDPSKVPVLLRWIIYFSLILFILFFAAPDDQFIYFQF